MPQLPAIGVNFNYSPPRSGSKLRTPWEETVTMHRNNLIGWMLAVCFIALIPSVGAQAGDTKAAMSALQPAAAKLGEPKVQGTDLYFGDTKASSDLVDAVVKSHGVVASIFEKSGNQYVRVEDGSSAVGTPLAADSPALAKLNTGEPYYGDATIFGKTYDAGYEPIKDASGAVVGAYFVG